MRRKLINGWLLLSALWIIYGAYYALSYWWNWGDFISEENRVSVWTITIVEILAAPVVGGVVLFACFGVVNGVRYVAKGQFRSR
ncbi:hypothetical protein KUL25_00295 [Rhodobacteraceae bacterium N5(2021)]|uniref:Uncharacterized protein n=1 Tax=Gymnodinialimonas phycosphaerae TaxID=2841589 RepID=A0A975TUY2_9RHOB|nr:hypothetical protein [Gymnodinialimonas phycosphaerae]MBY4891199.1 hypothetical protein [Gymnodinialimonas phycosphaerae]